MSGKPITRMNLHEGVRLEISNNLSKAMNESGAYGGRQVHIFCRSK